MSKKRWQALALAGAVLMSMFLGGCKTSKKEKDKKGKNAEKKAEAMLDDFCAYFKSGKYEKLGKLIDGDSEGLTKLLGYKDSPAEDVHEAARKRISYTIESVTVDEDEEEGTAIVVFTYFDTKDLKKKVKDGDTVRDIARSVGEAKEIDLEFEVDLVLDDDWLIDAASVDTIVEEMYSFMEEIDLEIEPTVSTRKAKDLTEFSSSWQDEYYNTVEGYHQSAKFIKFTVILWENCYGETVRFEFEDDNGVAYSGECYLDGGTDMVECIWEPTSKITSDWIACYVYDENNNIISVGCVQIYGDDEQIPINDIYIYNVSMVDENGQQVPGYHLNDTYIAAQIEMGNYGQDVELTYQFVRNDGGSKYTIYDATTIMTDGSSALLVWENMPAPPELQEASYELWIFNHAGDQIWTTMFGIVEEGKDFACDADTAEVYFTMWSSEDGYWDDISSVSSSTTEVYFLLETYNYYTYMQFAYTVKDGSGNVLDEGVMRIINDDMTDFVRIDLSGMEKGPITIEILNPDGSLLTESSLEVR